MEVKKVKGKCLHYLSVISLFAITFTGVATPSLLNLDSQRLEARPCKKTWFGRLGCALDPTNPKRNGGVVQPVIVKPIQRTVKRYAKQVSCTTAGAVTGTALAFSGLGTGLTVVGGTLATDACYQVWEK
jgi:hypothetical protein